MKSSSYRPLPEYDEGHQILRRVLIAAMVLGGTVAAGVILVRSSPESCEAPFIRDIQQASVAIRRDNTDVAAHLQRAAAYRELGKHGKAAADCSRAITLGAKDADVYLTRAKCFNVIDRNPAALEDIRRAQELSPPSPRSHHLLADIHSDMGNYDEALAAFTEGLKLDPTNVPLLTCQARMFRKKGDLDDAERGFNAALALDPSDAYAYHCRGQLFAEMGEHAKAVDDFNAALDAEPTCFLRRLWVSTYLARGKSAHALGLKRYRADLFKAVYEILRQKMVDRRIQAAESAKADAPQTGTDRK